MITFAELKEELRVEPTVAAEYEVLKPRFAKLHEQIATRRKARLAKAAAVKPRPPVPLRSSKSSHNH
jgi:hypothetical protein